MIMNIMNQKPLIAKDIPAILEIEQVSFDFPWGRQDIIESQRHKNGTGLTIKNEEDKLIGYVIYFFDKNKIIIRRLAVHPDFKRTGVGTMLVKTLIDKLSDERFRSIYLVTRETNLPSLLFFKNLKFISTIKKNYYNDFVVQDGVVMEYFF